MVSRVTESNIYHTETYNDHQIIYARMKLGFTFINIEYFIKHLYYPAKSSLAWTLDYQKNSDLDDSVGLWYVSSLQHDWCRVYYSVELVGKFIVKSLVVKLFILEHLVYDWIPKFIKQILSKKALTEATAWVKYEAELQWKQERYVDNSADEKTTKKRSKLSNFFIGLKKKILKPVSKKDDVKIIASSSLSLFDNETCNTTQDEISQISDIEVFQSITKTRVGLVCLLFVLIVYNLVLCLERLSLSKMNIN